MEETVKMAIRKYAGDSAEFVEDFLAAEKKLLISVNGKEFLGTYCTPSMIRELVVGLLSTEGIIKNGFCPEKISIQYRGDIYADVPVDEAPPSYTKTLTTGCGSGITLEKKREISLIRNGLSIKKEALKTIFREFQARSMLYRLTGCVHSAALSDGKSILFFAEDIGRHNAVDKVIGSALFEDMPFSDKLLLASGRVSSEIASKCSYWGIPILATRAAPTGLASEIAEKNGLTLIGFVRGERFNVYTHPERIL